MCHRSRHMICFWIVTFGHYPQREMPILPASQSLGRHSHIHTFHRQSGNLLKPLEYPEKRSSAWSAFRSVGRSRISTRSYQRDRFLESLWNFDFCCMLLLTPAWHSKGLTIMSHKTRSWTKLSRNLHLVNLQLNLAQHLSKWSEGYRL